jgi:putative acyl-CoA dehydrogenase
MGDILLLTAQTDAGVTLFIAPRMLPSGERNNIHIQRLKNKLGNESNASSEVELNGALAYRIGEEGRGIRQFIKFMTHYIRMGLATGSAGIMRQALTLSLHHTSTRKAFGETIRDLPQMNNALADLAIESEAAFLLGLRSAKATDESHHSEPEQLLNRVLVPVAKYWNCRRANAVTLEAMECHGGMGYVEEQSIARFYREAPLNSIWEGTSAMMGLDMIRAFDAFPETRDVLLDEIKLAKGADRHLDAYAARLENDLSGPTSEMEPHARRLMTMIAQAVQGSLLIRQSTQEVADTFCSSRLGGEWGHELGTLRQDLNSLRKIVDRSAISC